MSKLYSRKKIKCTHSNVHLYFPKKQKAAHQHFTPNIHKILLGHDFAIILVQVLHFVGLRFIFTDKCLEYQVQIAYWNHSER